MNSILDSSEVREALAPMSVEFYQSASDLGWFGEDVELLEGFPVKKRSKSPLHENLVEELLERIRSCLHGDRWVSKERPIQCAISQPEPDIAVFAGPRDFRATTHPTTAEFVIEVAVNTLEKDLRKAAIYAAADVAEYWVVDPKTCSILVHPATDRGRLRRDHPIRLRASSPEFPHRWFRHSSRRIAPTGLNGKGCVLFPMRLRKQGCGWKTAEGLPQSKGRGQESCLTMSEFREPFAPSITTP